MSKKIRAIKIDVEKREVYEIELEPGLEAMCAAIGCRGVRGKHLNESNRLWLDDNALWCEPQPDKFLIMGYDQPMAGNGLVCGFNDRGETVSTFLDVSIVLRVVRWAYDLHIEPDCGFMSWSDFGSRDSGGVATITRPVTKNPATDCQHARTRCDNYGQTCQDCGQVLGGYGYFGEGRTSCLHHWEPSANPKRVECLYCHRTLDADKLD